MSKKPMKAWQLIPPGSTLNQNRNSDVGNNHGQRLSLNVPNSGADIQILINDNYVEKLLRKENNRIETCGYKIRMNLDLQT